MIVFVIGVRMCVRVFECLCVCVVVSCLKRNLKIFWFTSLFQYAFISGYF